MFLLKKSCPSSFQNQPEKKIFPLFQNIGDYYTGVFKMHVLILTGSKAC
jgi:hypothetical protein